ncbi:MAG: Gfo/Idh/MocA family protein [bacterium]
MIPQGGIVMFTQLDRRDFMRTTGGTLGLCLASKTPPAFGAAGANEKVNLGFIALGWRNGDHLRDFQKMDSVNIAALGDVDSSRLAQWKERIGGGVRTFKDFRGMLDQKDIDAVVIATPDHWHCTITVLACRAGKDVYVEKVLGHNLHEETLAVQAAREHQRVVQIGLQQRSGPHFIEAAEIVRSGKLGQITTVHCFNNWGIYEMFHKGPDGLGNPPDSDPPEGVDYDMWLGPAPKRPFNVNRFHITHYFNWDYCGGMTTSWGVHLFDIVSWVMGHEINRVSVSGGKYFYKHNVDTPDTLEAVFDCPGYTMTYSLRQANGYPLHGEADHGIYFFGAEGTLFVNRSRYEHYTEKDRKTPVIGENRGMDLQHKQKFLDSLKSRKITDSDVETGHLSGIPAHLANIAFRTGRSIQWDNQNQTILGDPEAARYLSRAPRKPWDLI